MATTASPALGPRYLASATGMGRDRAALPAPVPLPAEITALPWQDAAQLHLAIQQLLKCPCPFWRLQHPPSTQVRAGAATVPSPWGSPGSGHTITNHLCHHGHQHRTGLISHATWAALCPHLGPPSAAAGATHLGLTKSRGSWPARPCQPNHREMGLRAWPLLPEPPTTLPAPQCLLQPSAALWHIQAVLVLSSACPWHISCHQ